jgi:diguanylate cyclase (GGDEF)-like protein
MVVHRDAGAVEHRQFRDLVEYVRPGDALVLNTTRVIRARLLGLRDSGAPAEVLLLKPLGDDRWEAMVHPGSKLKPGRVVHVAPGFDVEVAETTERRTRVVRLRSAELPPLDAVERFGHVPLPPYIERADQAADAERYQTVYADVAGSVAAPTAGLHFTQELLAAIERRLHELHEAAAVDELTGALRRAAGLAALEREVRRARRYGDRKLVVVFLDGVGLKAINDQRGHAAGDAQIRELAAALRRRLRAYDLLIRWGGDEFVCALPQAGLVGAERVLADVAADLASRTGGSFRAGFAELGSDASADRVENGAEALVARADADLRRERWGDSRQKRQGSSLHSPA